jgi:glutamyl-tRNA synthetase
MESLGGLMILRMEDLDTPRIVPGADVWIRDDLERLGLIYDEGPHLSGAHTCGPWRQSEREGLYWECLGQLADAGLVYPCRCSRRELREASAPHGPDGFVYPGTCRPTRPVPVNRELLRQGDTAWRLRLDSMGLIQFRDSLRGVIREDVEAAGDFVVRRRDGLWAYQFACAVDDWLMGVTHVLRGEDLLSSTARQLAVLSSLGASLGITYCHVPLVGDLAGAKLSKRDGSAGMPRRLDRGEPDCAFWQSWVMADS